MKKMAGLWFAVLFVIVQSCASLGTTGKSVIVIDNRDDNNAFKYRVYIDGKGSGIIKAGQTKLFNVSNGRHSVRAEWKYATWSALHSVSLELDYERIELSMGPSGFRERSKVSLSRPMAPPAANSVPLNDTAIAKSFDTLSLLVADGSKIAILNIAPNNDDGRYINEELMIKFVNSRKYIIVDRDTLATIRQEQQFQMAGEVSDDSAVSIGHFLGADVVITGSITGIGNQRRLRLRALDVKTAQVLAMSSENI
jgi:hypothetical protein